MQESDYQFKLLALDYTKDHLCSHVTKATNSYDFWFKPNFNFQQLGFNFIESKKLDLQNLPTSNCSLDRILSFKKYTDSPLKKSILTTHCVIKNFFVNTKISSPYSPSTQYALSSSYLHGRIHNYDPPKENFFYTSEKNPTGLSLSHVKVVQYMTRTSTFTITNDLLY